MLKAIIVKEIRDNISNLRFSAGMILTALLTLLCVIILSGQYRQELSDYQARLSIQDEFLAKYAHTNRMSGISSPEMPPKVFRPFIMSAQSASNSYMGGFFEDHMNAMFPNIDLIFIVTVIMSLLAILFSYDAVTEEREKGTLRLINSYSVKRPIYLLGKWIGGSASLMIPFIISILAGALYIVIHPSIRWESSAFATFFLLILSSMTFISSFYLLGLFVSTRTRNSSTSLLISLFLWVLLILVIPNLSPYLAAQVYRIPSVTKHSRIITRMRSEERDELGRSLSRKVTEKYRGEYGDIFADFEFMDNDGKRERIAADTEFASMVESYKNETNAAWKEANRIQREKATTISTDFNNQIKRQSLAAKNIACLSPFVNYLYVATDLTGTGLHGEEYFSTISGRYSGEFNKYLGAKIEEIKKSDPMFDSNTFIDIGDRPRFTFSEEPLRDRLIIVYKYFAMLVLFNLLFFVGAFVGFLKYDVR